MHKKIRWKNSVGVLFLSSFADELEELKKSFIYKIKVKR